MTGDLRNEQMLLKELIEGAPEKSDFKEKGKKR